jgi:hypothetical protein
MPARGHATCSSCNSRPTLSLPHIPGTAKGSHRRCGRRSHDTVHTAETACGRGSGLSGRWYTCAAKASACPGTSSGPTVAYLVGASSGLSLALKALTTTMGSPLSRVGGTCRADPAVQFLQGTRFDRVYSVSDSDASASQIHSSYVGAGSAG